MLTGWDLARGLSWRPGSTLVLPLPGAPGTVCRTCPKATVKALSFYWASAGCMRSSDLKYSCRFSDPHKVINRHPLAPSARYQPRTVGGMNKTGKVRKEGPLSPGLPASGREPGCMSPAPPFCSQDKSRVTPPGASPECSSVCGLRSHRSRV